MNLNCVICAELITATDDVNVTSCGHMFHMICLSKWLQRSETCPQCRKRCTGRNVIRVYFNMDNLNVSRIDVGSLQEQLHNVELKLKVKEKELQRAVDVIKCFGEGQKDCRSKTCPQCRNKCTDRNIVRVYFNLANLDVSRIDVYSLQEQLDNVQLQLKVKERELQKAGNQIEHIKETERQSMKMIDDLQKDIVGKQCVILNYAEKTKLLESQMKMMDSLRKEHKALKEQIETMKGVNTLLTSTVGDAEKLLSNENNPKILSVWVTALKRELKVCENKKSDIHKVLKVVQRNLHKEIDQRKKQEEKISQLESENYELLEKIKVLEDTIKKNNNNKDIENSHSDNIGLNTEYNNSIPIMSSSVNKIKGEKRLTISPTIKSSIKKIEESSSPYLNIKSCSVLTPHLLMKKYETRINNNTKQIGNKVRVLKVSPPKPTGTGVIRKIKSDLSQKYTIFKKPRYDLAASGSTIKPSAHKFVSDGFGGLERVDPFENSSDDDCSVVSTETEGQTEAKSKLVLSSTINSRLKAGGLRNFKLTK